MCRQVGEAEHLSAAQNREVQQFLDGIVQTPCMQYLHQFLIAQVCNQRRKAFSYTCNHFYLCASCSCKAVNRRACEPLQTLQHQPCDSTHCRMQQLADHDTSAFKQQLYQMWFRSYTREVRDDSSGFEHVFVGEARDGKILGLHNWIQFSDQEQRGKLDYKGYIFPRVHRYGVGKLICRDICWCCTVCKSQKPFFTQTLSLVCNHAASLCRS